MSALHDHANCVECMNADAESERLAALRELMAMASGEHTCPRCHGDGEVRFNLTNDPQMEDIAICPDCNGEGVIA